MKTFSNHAGTMSPSFLVGKRGIAVAQGTDAPTVDTDAPVGSIYIQKPVGVGALAKTFQKLEDGAWVQMAPVRISSESSPEVLNGSVWQTIARVVRRKFTNSDLVAGKLTVAHGLSSVPQVDIYDSTGVRKVPLGVTVTAPSEIEISIDLESNSAITGEWTVVVVG